jgi:acyl carrier protein
LRVTSAEALGAMQAIFDTVIKRHDIVLRANLTAADVPGWDSLRYVSFVMAVEDRFKITFEESEVKTPRNIGGVLTAVMGKLGLEP